MVPYKHYAAEEIEEVLDEASKNETDAAARTSPETHAEESTLRRWRNEFFIKMPLMTQELEQIYAGLEWKGGSLIKASKGPLSCLRQAVEALQILPFWMSRLAYAFKLLKSHAVCL
jgi:hypothetical protein